MSDLQPQEPLPTVIATASEPGPPPDAPRVPRPRVWTVFVAFAGAIVVQLVGALAVLLAASLVLVIGHGGLPSPHELATLVRVPGVMLGLVAIGGVGPAALAVLCAALSPEATWARLAFRRAGLRPRTIGVAIVGGLSLSYSMGLLAVLLRAPNSRTAEFLVEVFQGATGYLAPLAVLVFGIVGPACEELFFRGYVQTRLCRRWGAAWGIGVSSTLFGLIHFDLVQSSMALVLGLYLGWLAYRSRSILPAIAVHASNNLLWTLHVATGGRPPRSLEAALLPILLAGAAAATAWLHGRLAHAEAPEGGASATEAPATGAACSSPTVDV